MAKVKVDISGLSKSIKKFERDAVVEARKSNLDTIIRDEILERIAKGRSPVKNGGNFEKYSDSYKKQIRRRRYPGKSIRPVNLKLSGKMLKSLFVKIRSNAARLVYTIGFNSEIAEYHNDGTNKMPARRLLPTKKGETLAKPILTIIRRILEQSVNRVAKRQR